MSSLTQPRIAQHDYKAEAEVLTAKLAVLQAERDAVVIDRDRLDGALYGMWKMWQERLTDIEQDAVTEAAMDAMQQSGRLAK